MFQSARLCDAYRSHGGTFRQGIDFKPGGDKIGRRRLDTHFLGIQKLGASFNYDAVNGVF